MDIFSLLIVGHIFGTILGVGGATMVEIFLNKSLKDGHIDPIEGSFMHTTFTVVRVGLIISLFTGFGLLLVYRFEEQMFRFYDPMLWAKFTLIGVIVVNALLLQAHKIPIWLGAPLSFVSWWSVAIIGTLLSGPNVSYAVIIFWYLVALVIGGFVLEKIRRSMRVSQQQ